MSHYGLKYFIKDIFTKSGRLGRISRYGLLIQKEEKGKVVIYVRSLCF